MKWEDKNILITGINGFNGSYLANNLIEKGSNVFGLVRDSTNRNFTIEDKFSNNLFKSKIINNSKLMFGDLLDKTSLDNAIKESSPDIIFHLAAQTFIPESFKNPSQTQLVNGIGTLNLLESIMSSDFDGKLVSAGSSEEYGLVFSSKNQFEEAKKKYGAIFPLPNHIPEVPINENNFLRPMSPYGISKVQSDFLIRNYHTTYGLDAVVSRPFSNEGAGRGLMFVTSVITEQIIKYKHNLIDRINIGNINIFKDWSHVKDIVNDYLILAEKGISGDVYNMGSMRTNSILTYILFSLEEANFSVDKIKTLKNDKVVRNPTELNNSEMFGTSFEKSKIDSMMLENEINFNIEDKGIDVVSNDKKIRIEFDKNRFRHSDVPILLSDTKKIQKIGSESKFSVKNIINDQLDYFNKNY